MLRSPRPISDDSLANESAGEGRLLRVGLSVQISRPCLFPRYGLLPIGPIVAGKLGFRSPGSLFA